MFVGENEKTDGSFHFKTFVRQEIFQIFMEFFNQNRGPCIAVGSTLFEQFMQTVEGKKTAEAAKVKAFAR